MEESAAMLFVEAFINQLRVSRLIQLLGYHPKYLQCFLRTHNFLMRGDGPLPYPVRHYIAILVSVYMTHRYCMYNCTLRVCIYPIYIHTYIHTTYVCTYMRMRTYIHAHTGTYICMHMHAYTHTHTHTHIQASLYNYSGIALQTLALSYNLLYSHITMVNWFIQCF